MNSEYESIEEKTYERLRVVVAKATGVILPEYGKKTMKPIENFLKEIADESIGTGKALIMSQTKNNIIKATSNCKEAEPLKRALKDILNGYQTKPISIISKELYSLHKLVNLGL